MANSVFQIKRTSVAGRAANSTTLPNAGELALNMADQIMYSTNGTVVFEIGANATSHKSGNATNFVTANSSGLYASSNTQKIQLTDFMTINSSTIYIGNSTSTYFMANSTYLEGMRFIANAVGIETYNGSGLVVLQQVANGNIGISNGAPRNALSVNGLIATGGGITPYTNSTGTALGNSTARWVVTANALNMSGNLTLDTASAIIANATPGTAGQVLTTTGTSVYWSTVSGGPGGSVDTANNWAWTGNHTHTGSISIGNATSNVFANSTVIQTYQDGLPILYLAANGNIGLGNSSPNARLLVTGAIRVSGGINPTSNTATAFGSTTQRIQLVANTITMSGNLTLDSTTSAIIANSTPGTMGQVLTSNGTAVFWRGIVNSASSSGSSISVGTTAPATPSVGDLWVDTN